MKILLLILLYFTFLETKSQTVQVVSDSMPVAVKLNYNLYEKAKKTGKVNGGTLYLLPQDNMPAIQPDTSINYNMPVITFKPSPYRSYKPVTGQQNQHPVKKPPTGKDSIIQTPDSPKKISNYKKNNTTPPNQL